MCKLDRQGILPLPRFVRVDIDRIRSLLPEMEGYVRRDPMSAGFRTQKEAGLIAEIVTEEALARGLNVWIDSSMRDAKWWSQELERIKRTYPHRTAIMHVTASWDRVREREAKRGEQTGRRIPRHVLREVYKRVPPAVKVLRPLVDEYIQIDNDDGKPTLKTASDVRSLLRVCRDVGGDCESRHLEQWIPGWE